MRDLVGYGANPPHAGRPNGARIAVNFVLNYEEGSEYSIGEGDGHSDIFLTEMNASPIAHGDRDLAAESMFEYGSRVLAHPAHVPGAATADDCVRLRARA